MSERLPRPGTWAYRVLAAALVTVVITALVALALETDRFGALRTQLLDRFFPTGPTSEQILVVEVGASDIEQVGGWPWSRDLHATIVDRLAGAGADVIGYDLVFADPRPDDDRLARAIAQAGNVVLAQTGALRPAERDGLLRLSEPRVGPVPVLADAAAVVAHANVWSDPFDGVVRGLPVVVEEDRRFVPALSVALVALSQGADPRVPTLRPEGVQIGDQLYPAPREARRVLDLNWTRELDWFAPDRPAVGAAAVLSGTFDPADVEGRIVLVGVADPLLGDFVNTPVAKAGGAPGVYVHASAVNTMLTGFHREPIDDTRTLLTVALVAFVTTLVALRLPLSTAPLLVLATILAFIAYADLRFERARTTDLLWPNLAVVMGAVGAVVIRYVTEEREKRRVAELFGHYIPPQVAEELIASRRLEAATQGERADITVFFCDLRGFTRAAAGLEPSEVRGLLNVYYEHVTDLILEHGGTVMQYVGDEVFAVFGAPVPREDHPQRAVDCAVAVRDSISDLSDRLLEMGLPPVAFGIGLNTGPVVAAHVGTFHKQYAVIGDTVNVGSRFCSLAEAHQIALPGELRDRLTDPPPLIAVGPVAMKGVEREIEVLKVGKTSEGTPVEGYAANLTAVDETPKAVELGPG